AKCARRKSGSEATSRFGCRHTASLSGDQGWIVPPDNFTWVQRSAAINAGRVGIHNLFATHCPHPATDEHHVSGAVVPCRKLVGESFWLTGVSCLKFTKSFLGRNSVIKKKRGPIGHLDFAELSTPQIAERWPWLGALFEVAHELGIDGERKVGICRRNSRKTGGWTMEYFSGQIKILL